MNTRKIILSGVLCAVSMTGVSKGISTKPTEFVCEHSDAMYVAGGVGLAASVGGLFWVNSKLKTLNKELACAVTQAVKDTLKKQIKKYTYIKYALLTGTLISGGALAFTAGANVAVGGDKVFRRRTNEDGDTMTIIESKEKDDDGYAMSEIIHHDEDGNLLRGSSEGVKRIGKYLITRENDIKKECDVLFADGSSSGIEEKRSLTTGKVLKKKGKVIKKKVFPVGRFWVGKKGENREDFENFLEIASKTGLRISRVENKSGARVVFTWDMDYLKAKGKKKPTYYSKLVVLHEQHGDDFDVEKAVGTICKDLAKKDRWAKKYILENVGDNK